MHCPRVLAGRQGWRRQLDWVLLLLLLQLLLVLLQLLLVLLQLLLVLLHLLLVLLP